MPTLSKRKRQAIVDAAIEEFQRNGFQGTSMDAIAATASVSKRTVYNHFESKASLFNSIAQQVWQTANQAVDVTFLPDVSVYDQLKQAALNELALVSDPHFKGILKVLLAEFMHNQALADETLSHINKEESHLTLWFKEASLKGALNVEDPEAACKHFYGLIKSLALWPQLLMGEKEIPSSQHEKIANDICTMFFALYGNSD